MSGAGQLITDGSVVWIVDDVRDGSRVGDIIIRPTLRDGYVKANGATLKASEYPRLLRYAQDNSLTVTAAVYATNCSKYVYDSTADTLQVPNMTGRVLQGGDTVASKEAGLPNITGDHFDVPHSAPFGHNGAFVSSYRTAGCIGIVGSVGDSVHVYFNAANCNPIYGNSATVQPPALQMIAQIKY